MRQQDIVSLLNSYGFSGIHLVKQEGNASTYKYFECDLDRLKSDLGTPSKASGGKVFVFSTPAGKVGVTDTHVRFIDVTEDTAKVSDKHLSKVPIPANLQTAFLQAAVNPRLHVPFCKKLFEYLNTSKFDDKLPTPKFLVSEKHKIKNARGVYSGGPHFGPGTIWMASFMFNARMPFFVEVFLHEMCHMAAWCISHSTDHSQQGHGPVWQEWMRNVGLDPRRFDPTDDSEYKLGQEQAIKEAQLTPKYGPRNSIEEIESLEPVKAPDGTRVSIVYQGRIFTGKITKKFFDGTRTANSKTYTIGLSYKTAPTTYKPFGD